jgi:AcrR family transcriptional regulator
VHDGAHLEARRGHHLAVNEQPPAPTRAVSTSAVTTDETARAAGVSKKTLYQHFPSKDALLEAVMRFTLEKRTADIAAICHDTGLSIPKRLRRMTDYLSRLYGEISPALIDDMRRNVPHVWECVEEGRQRCIQEDFGALLREGIARGDFRKDVDATVFMAMYAETIRHVLNPQSFARLGLPPARVFETVYRVLFEGFLTAQAR